MKTYKHALPPRRIKMMLPFSLSILVLFLVVVLLLISVSSLRKDNEALGAAISSLKSDNSAALDAVDALKKQSEKDTSGMQAQSDAIAAIQDGMKQLNAGAVHPKFSVDSFNLSFFSATDYKFQSYTGAGTISADDVQDSFLVLLKKTLKSGGAPTTQKVEYVPILVVNGTGAFNTEDSADGTVTIPDYAFQIVGYTRIATYEQAPTVSNP